MNPLMSLLMTVILSCLGAGEESNFEGKTLSQWTAQAQHESSQLRQQAAEGLAVIVMQSQDGVAAAALTQLLQDKDSGVRDCAFLALRDPDETVRLAAAAAIVKGIGKRNYEGLKRVVKDESEDPQVRSAAAQALQKLSKTYGK